MSVESLIRKFNADLGEGTIHTGNKVTHIRRMPSCIPMVNYVSFGGFHIGRINELVGGYSGLKSYLAYDQIARFQRYDWANHELNAFTALSLSRTGKVEYRLRRGYKPAKKPIARRAVLNDIEGTYTKDWGEEIFGINNETLIRLQPESPADAINVVAALMRERDICLGVHDSASIVEMDDESDKGMDEATMGSNTRFWSRAIRKVSRSMNANPLGATFLLINSVYSKVGMVMGNPEVVRNGEQLRLAKSLSIYLRGLTELKDEGSGEVLGRNVSVKCLKNKGGGQGRQGEFFYAYTDLDDGMERYTTNAEEQYIELATKYEIIIRKGNHYEFEGERAKGMQDLNKMIREERELYEKLRRRVDREVICNMK